MVGFFVGPLVGDLVGVLVGDYKAKKENNQISGG
jgi:hypothetical protein